MDKQFIRDQFKGGHIYSFIGAGGKTSAIKEIARVLVAEGYKVLITTSTKISIDEFSDYSVEIEKNIDINNLQHGLTVLVSGISGKKYQGYVKEELENIVQIPLDIVILIEADGSRRLPFKVPYKYEPVIPFNSTKTLLFFSAKVIGEKITRENTYNLEKVEEILGTSDLTYSNDNIIKLIAEGWLADTNYRNLKVVINQGDLVYNDFIAKDLLNRIYNRLGIGAYLVSIKEKKIYHAYDVRIGALILAAGEGKRMGGIKQLMEFNNSSFLAETIKKYSAYTQEIIVTLGYHEAEIRNEIKELGFKYQQIVGYKEGMSASFREAYIFNADFFLVTPCDLPLIENNTIELLIRTYRNNPGNIIVPRFKGKKGHPVVFPSELQRSFSEIKGDIGARDIIKDKGCIYVDLDDPGIIADIDTLNEYMKIKEEYYG